MVMYNNGIEATLEDRAIVPISEHNYMNYECITCAYKLGMKGILINDGKQEDSRLPMQSAVHGSHRVSWSDYPRSTVEEPLHW